jgi:hypothetical protein
MIKKYLYTITLVATLFCGEILSQNVGVGADAMWNFQSESFGAGARISIFPNNRLSFVPQFSYYFPFNPVHEHYSGMSLEYKFFRRRKVDIYLIGYGGYHAWINHEASPMEDTKRHNWAGEGGLGIAGTKCWRPFLEYRYNVRFKETHLRLGIMYVLGCKPQKWGFGFDDGKGKVKRCMNYSF